jgi:hypothetical protein
MYPIIQHQLVSARIADLHRQAERGRMAQAARSVRQRPQAARWRAIAVLARRPSARRLARRLSLRLPIPRLERTSVMFQPVRGIARSLLVPAAFAAVALTGQQAVSAAALPTVHFSPPTLHYYAAPETHRAAQPSGAVTAGAPAESHR